MLQIRPKIFFNYFRPEIRNPKRNEFGAETSDAHLRISADCGQVGGIGGRAPALPTCLSRPRTAVSAWPGLPCQWVCQMYPRSLIGRNNWNLATMKLGKKIIDTFFASFSKLNFVLAWMVGKQWKSSLGVNLFSGRGSGNRIAAVPLELTPYHPPSHQRESVEENASV